MIAVTSASFPVLGAARATSLDYGLALAWVDARGRGDWPAARRSGAAAKESLGPRGWRRFKMLVFRAERLGFVRPADVSGRAVQ